MPQVKTSPFTLVGPQILRPLVMDAGLARKTLASSQRMLVLVYTPVRIVVPIPSRLAYNQAITDRGVAPDRVFSRRPT
jgi:hypothetical protein